MVRSRLVSIVVPVYNAERFLEDTINTVRKQTYENWELLLVDDCSTDKCERIVSKYKDDKRIRWIKQIKNVGPARTRNHGISLANGEYLCFLDADDKWDEKKIEKQIDYMKRNKCAFCYHSYEFADEKCTPNGKRVIAKNKLTYRQALKNTIIFTSTVMFDLKQLNKSDIMMPDIKYIEDTATWWKILRNGIDAYGMPDVFSLYRRSPNTDSSKKIRMQRSLWYVYRKVEKLNLFYAAYCWFWKNTNAVIRRI